MVVVLMVVEGVLDHGYGGYDDDYDLRRVFGIAMVVVVGIKGGGRAMVGGRMYWV